MRKADPSAAQGSVSPVQSSLDANDDYTSAFNEWIKRCGMEGATKHENTFTDDKGIVRHVENWQVFDTEAHNSSRFELNTIGCTTIPVQMNTSDGDVVTDAGKQNVFDVTFLMDYRTLWDFLEREPTDEMSEYSPLFRIYVEMYFHTRTVQIMTAAVIYYLIVLISADQAYRVSPPLKRFIDYTMVAIQGFVYLAMVVLFKGSIFPKENYQSAERGDDASVKENISRRSRTKQTLNCMHYVREALRKSTEEVQVQYARYSRTRQHHSSSGGVSADGGRDGRGISNSLHVNVPFYDTLNIALKFLTRRSGKRQGGDNAAKKHNWKLLFIFFCVPVYVILIMYATPVSPYYLYIEICNGEGWHSVYCKNLSFTFYLTLGYTIPVLIKILFISSVLIALVGQAIGSDIGRGLVNSWLHRFGSLRRLGAPSASSSSTATTQSDGDQRKTWTAIGTETVSSAAAGNANGGDSSVFNELHAPPTPLNLKRIDKSDPGQASKSTSKPQPAPPDTTDAATTAAAGSMSIAELPSYVQRDAFEHYMFIREYMSCASRTWSITIVALTFLDVFYVFIFIASSVAAANKTNVLMWTFYVCWVIIRIALLSVYPITSLAHANAYVYALQEQFLVAAPEDFGAIGGRDKWLEYLDKVPAVWTIYGVAVTWDRLTGLLWTTIAGLGALAITISTSSSSGS